jgi:hypothetical protein
MSGPYAIAVPTKTQPITAGGFGVPVRDAINDLDARATVLETSQQYVIKRARRTTPYSTAIVGTETGILRLDDIPFRAGRVIQLTTTPIPITSTVANDIASIRIRILTSASPGGTVTTATGGILVKVRPTISNITTYPLMVLNAFYYAVSDGYMSAMISAQREAGTGNITLPISTTDNCDLVAQDAGIDPGNTGVSL